MSFGPRETPISGLFPVGVVTAVRSVAEGQGELYPEERACISGAAPKRVHEFTAGRLMARAVLAELGIQGFPLVVGPDRAPLWPPNVVGSISHTRDLCGVAAARREPLLGIGLDIEFSEVLGKDLWRLVLTPDEQAWLEQRTPGERGRLAKVMFSAKECTYKCQVVVSRQWLDFQDVEISLDLQAGFFTARFLTDVDHLDSRTRTGKFSFVRDHVFTGMTWIQHEGENKSTETE